MRFALLLGLLLAVALAPPAPDPAPDDGPDTVQTAETPAPDVAPDVVTELARASDATTAAPAPSGLTFSATETPAPSHDRALYDDGATVAEEPEYSDGQRPSERYRPQPPYTLRSRA